MRATWHRPLSTPLAFLLTLLAALCLAGCAGLTGPRQVELPLAKLQQRLDQRFPLQQRVLELFEVQLSHPQLSLLPDQNRIALALDASLTQRLTQKNWRGSLTLSGRLTLDPARNAVIIGDLQVERMDLGGVDASRQRILADLAINRLVREVPLYNFHPEDLRFAGVQFTPTAIAMTANALVVTFTPGN